MHIHKPKAFHSLRTFLAEISVIVVGILIALGLEQGVGLMHEQKIADEARKAVRAEVRENLWWLNVRNSSEPCVRQRLRELGDVLSKARHGQPFPITQHLGLVPHAKLTILRWEANAQAGRASLFTPEEQRNLGNVYFTTSEFAQAQREEEAVWSKLRAIQGLDRLTPAEIHDFSVLLAQAKYLNFRIVLSMYRAHQWANLLHLSPENPGTVDTGSSGPPELCRPITAERDNAKASLSDPIFAPDDWP